MKTAIGKPEASGNRTLASFREEEIAAVELGTHRGSRHLAGRRIGARGDNSPYSVYEIPLESTNASDDGERSPPKVRGCAEKTDINQA